MRSRYSVRRLLDQGRGGYSRQGSRDISSIRTGVPLAGFSRAGAVDTVGAVGDGGGGKSSESSLRTQRGESSEFGVYDM